METHPSVLALENPMDRGVWWALVHGVAKSRTPRKQLSTALEDVRIGQMIPATDPCSMLQTPVEVTVESSSQALCGLK